jgi:hypothetical protein
MTTTRGRLATCTLAAMLMAATIPVADADHGATKGGTPVKHGPLHGPGSSHNPIVHHGPLHGPGSSHNPIVVPKDCNDPNTLCRRP